MVGAPRLDRTDHPCNVLVEATHTHLVLDYVQVDDPHNSAMFEKHGVADGQFVFTTKQAGEYKTCFTARGGWVKAHQVLAGACLRAVCACGLLAQGQGSTPACAHLACSMQCLGTACHRPCTYRTVSTQMPSEIAWPQVNPDPCKWRCAHLACNQGSCAAAGGAEEGCRC